MKAVNVVWIVLTVLLMLTGCNKKGVVNAKYEAVFHKDQAKLKDIRAKGKDAAKKVDEVKTTIATAPIEPTSTTSSVVVDVPLTTSEVITTSEVATSVLPTSTIEQVISSTSETLEVTPTNVLN